MQTPVTYISLLRLCYHLDQRTHTKEALTRHASCDFARLKRNWPLKLRHVYEVLLDDIVSLLSETKGDTCIYAW